MAISESETSEIAGRETAGIDPLDPAQSIRQYLGLEVEHLLPGLKLAANMLQRGDNEDALRTCSLLVLCDPTEVRFQLALAACALEVGDFHIAALAASAIVSGAPEDPQGYIISGRAFIGMRDFDIAIEDLREAVRLAEEAGDGVAARQAGVLLERARIAREVQAKN